MPFCNRCGGYTWDDLCGCKPYEVYHPEYTGWDDPKVIYASDEEEAAKGYAKYFNEDGDYTMMQSGNECITVRVGEGDKAQWYHVNAEPAIDYHVQEATDDIPEHEPGS